MESNETKAGVSPVLSTAGLGEVCTYCGKLPSEHLTYPYDHKPILLSEIINERKQDAANR